jgi:hypothetical protein
MFSFFRSGGLRQPPARDHAMVPLMRIIVPLNVAA